MKNWNFISLIMLCLGLMVYCPVMGQDTEPEEFFICVGDCVDIGKETDMCFKWLPEDGLENPMESRTQACPKLTQTYSLIITNDDGDIIERIDYKVNILDENNYEEILSFFQEKNFTILPIIDILGPINFNSSDNNDKSSNCDINDYAELLVTIFEGELQGEEINIAQSIEGELCNENTTFYITSNADFCSGNDLLGEVSDEFNSCEKFVIWYHIFDMSEIDPDAPDLLIFNHNEDNLYSCNQETNGSLEFVGLNCQDFLATNPNQPEFTFSVTQRAFGPWSDFGHLPLIPFLNLTTLTKNNFIGDNRTFSLGEHKETRDPDPLKASSRTYQKATVTLGNNGLAIPDERLSSGTTGILNMCPDWVPSIITIITAGGVTTIPTPCDPTPPCDWDNPNACDLTGTIYGGARFENNELYMKSFGKDECVWYSTNIDMRSHFSFEVENINNKSFLTVKGATLNKKFPSSEVFIEDNFQNKVFLYTFAPEGEDKIITPGLFTADYDEAGLINISIEVDNEGRFLNEIRYKNYSGDPLILSGVESDSEVQLLCFGNFDFSEPNTISRTNWNQNFLDSNPAGDCLDIPCCGNLGCCDE